jgi:hypothetical protein
MKLKSFQKLLPALISLVDSMHLFTLPMQAQDIKTSLDQTAFSAAAIKWNPDTHLPSDIKLDASAFLNKDDFFTKLRNAFELPTHLHFESPVDDSEYKLLILRNKGIEALNITEIHLSDPDHFTISPPAANTPSNRWRRPPATVDCFLARK